MHLLNICSVGGMVECRDANIGLKFQMSHTAQQRALLIKQFNVYYATI